MHTHSLARCRFYGRWTGLRSEWLEDGVDLAVAERCT
jgi:hypothetical protein